MLKIITIISLILMTNISFAKATNCSFNKVSDAIYKFQTFKHNKKINHFFTKTILTYGKKYKIDCILMATIIKVESDYIHKTNPYTPSDYSIAQINYPVQKKDLAQFGIKLSKKKLMRSNKYAIKMMATILSIIKKRHHKDSLWYARYHSGLYLDKLRYLHRLEIQWKKLGYSDFFVDYNEKERIYRYCVKKYGWKKVAEIYTPMENKKKRLTRYKKRFEN